MKVTDQFIDPYKGTNHTLLEIVKIHKDRKLDDVIAVPAHEADAYLKGEVVRIFCFSSKTLKSLIKFRKKVHLCSKICATRNEYEEGRCTLEFGHVGSCFDKVNY